MTMTHSGRLLDPAGGPVEGAHDVTVRLTDAGGSELWSDTFTDVPLQNGYFASVLGSGAPPQTQDLAADAVNIGVTVGDGPVLSTTPMSSVPFAIRTEESRNLRGGSVQATTISGDSASIAGAVSADSAQISGLLQSGGVQTGDIASSGNIAGVDFSAASMTVDGPVNALSLESAGPVVGVELSAEQLSVEGANISGALTAGSIEANDAIVTGTVLAGELSADGLQISGDTVLAGVAANSLLTDSLEVSGDTVLTDVAASSLLTDSLDVSGSITAGTLTVDSIEASEILVNGQDFDGPIVGEWYPSVHRISSSGEYEFMTFDRERFNTDAADAYFEWDGNSTITFRKAGYYRVDMRSISYNNGEGNHFETWKNGSRLHLSHSLYSTGTSWRRHATSVVSYFAVGNTLRVRVRCATSTSTYCYHQGPDYTALTVQYMR